MAYVQLAKALYDYEAQAGDELSFKEDDTLYILEAEDAEWFKAKLRKLNTDDADDQVGLVPANYVEEAEPIRLSRALYDYQGQNEDELTIAEDELLRVYETDGLWLLVKKQGGGALGEGGVGRLGYVPANYVDEVATVDIGDNIDEAVDVENASPQAITASTSTGAVPMVTTTAALPVDKSDGIKMWAVSVLDAKKKKKKGTLGIGNAALFFASESDKKPVQKIPVLSVPAYSLVNKGKQLHVDLDPSVGIDGDAMDFVCDKKDGDEIASKLEESKAKAQRMATLHQSNSEASEKEAEHPIAPFVPAISPAPPVASVVSAPPAPSAPLAPPTASSFSPPPSRGAAFLPPPVRKTGTGLAPLALEPTSIPSETSADGERAVALYDFEAQGDDELSVAENDSLTLIERENDDWWKVRNASGQEGVVPASYVEVMGGTAQTRAVATHAGDEADAEAQTEAERQRQEEAAAVAHEEQLLAAEQRRKEARDRLAREAEERRRREALKAQPAPAPPKAAPSTATTDNARAARDVRIPEGRSAPARPKEAASKSKPAPDRTRVWHDRTGQFRVEAEFLGFNQGKLRLHKINGVVIEVAIEKMSKPDIQYLEEATGKSLMPRRSGLSSSFAAAAARDPRQIERQLERQRERERETRRRAESALGPRRNIDWFEFFLAAGVDVHDCTRYASAFERDNIDDTVLPDMEPSILRSLGLREGDNIRVMKYIEKKYKSRRSTPSSSLAAKTTSATDIEKQTKADEELARRLQEQESSVQREGDGSAASCHLFSGPNGSLKNNTRRGRPTPSSKASETAVDATLIARSSESLARVSSSSRRSNMISSTIERNEAKATSSSGFDDDAWTPRPSSTKPSTPVPPVKPATPQQTPMAAPTPPPAPLAPEAVATPPPKAHTSAEAPKPALDPNSALFEKLAAMKPPSADQMQQRTGAKPSDGLFLSTSGGYNPIAPRGPVAPVPQNQGLLQPLVPTHGTGQFIPTRNIGAQQTGWGDMQSQLTGFGGLQNQPTGFYSASAFQQQPQQTGYGGGGLPSQPSGWMGHQQTAMATNLSGFASPQPPSQHLTLRQTTTSQPTASQNRESAQNGASGTDEYSAGNIFASMKSGTFAKGDKAPQAAQKYDALRPQPTGWSPAGVQQPQLTGWCGAGGLHQQIAGMPGGMGMMSTEMGMIQPQFTAQPGMYQQSQYGGQQQQQQQSGYGQPGYGYQSY